jgi:predicted component of viral defense system (DUF524 family)
VATLLSASGSGWRLEIVGRVPELPPFVSSAPQWRPLASAEFTGLEILDVGSGRLISAVSDEMLAPVFFEGIGYDIHFERDTGCEATIELPPTAELRRRRPDSEHYSFDTGNNVGYFLIRVKETRSVASLRLEVFSRKADYRTDYEAMRDEVSSILRNLAMAANARTFGLAKPSPDHRPTLVEWFALLKGYHADLLKVAAAIARHPHTNLIDRSRLRHADRARRVSRAAISVAVRSGNAAHAIPAIGAALPRTLVEGSKHVTVDTPENRYYKAMLRHTVGNIRRLAKVSVSDNEDADFSAEAKFLDSVRPELAAMARKIDALRAAPFLRNVADVAMARPASMVFNKHPTYARFDRLARLLNGGLSFAGEVVPIGVKDTALLYEYWCFLKMVSLLGSRFDLEQQSIVKMNRYRTVVTLGKGRTAAIRFTHRSTGRPLHVVYNQLFDRLPTINQKPDNVIRFSSDEGFYIFDAKYRIQFDADYVRQYGGVGPTTEDINTMHRYRDAISIPDPVNPSQRKAGAVIGAAVLFPYPDERKYAEHRFFKSLQSVEIGGIPFLPGATSLLDAKLTQLLGAAFPMDSTA